MTVQLDQKAFEFFTTELGLTGRQNLQEMEQRWLASQGYTLGTLDERWRALAEDYRIDRTKYWSTFSIVDAVVSGAVAYQAESLALFNRITTVAPTYERKVLMDNLIAALKTAGVWSKLDALYLMRAQDGATARLNWIQDAYNLTAVNGPSFVADDYYRSVSGNSRYFATGFNPSTAPSPKFTSTDMSFGFWGLNDTTAATEAAMGAQISSTSNRAMIIPHTGSGTTTVNFRANENTTTTLVSTTGAGDFIVRRTGTTRSVLRDSVSLGSQTNSATGVPTFPFFIGGINNGGTLSNAITQNYVAAHIGGYLSDAEEAAFHTAKSTYLNAIKTIP